MILGRRTILGIGLASLGAGQLRAMGSAHPPDGDHVFGDVWQLAESGWHALSPPRRAPRATNNH